MGFAEHWSGPNLFISHKFLITVLACNNPNKTPTDNNLGLVRALWLGPLKKTTRLLQFSSVHHKVIYRINSITIMSSSSPPEGGTPPEEKRRSVSKYITRMKTVLKRDSSKRASISSLTGLTGRTTAEATPSRYVWVVAFGMSQSDIRRCQRRSLLIRSATRQTLFLSCIL